MATTKRQLDEVQTGKRKVEEVSHAGGGGWTALCSGAQVARCMQGRAGTCSEAQEVVGTRVSVSGGWVSLIGGL